MDIVPPCCLPLSGTATHNGLALRRELPACQDRRHEAAAAAQRRRRRRGTGEPAEEHRRNSEATRVGLRLFRFYPEPQPSTDIPAELQ